MCWKLVPELPLQYDRLPGLAADLVRRHAAVIVAIALPTALAAKATTSTTPIVFTSGGDPIQAGLVDSLNRPSGNVTGVSLFNVALEGKRVGLLLESHTSGLNHRRARKSQQSEG